MTFLSFILLTFSASTAQAATTYSGNYKVSSFRSVPATLSVSGGNAIRVSIKAPAAPCVVSFGTGVYQGTLGDAWGTKAIYELPVIESCGSPRMGYRFRLTIRQDRAGRATGAEVRGSNGKMSWTFFSAGR